jgi:peptidyl-prolyl cis-trans isomerase D
MLQLIREKITGVFAAVIIVFIGGTLVVSFGNMDAGVGPGDFAVKVNGEDVLMGDYRQIYQNQLLRQQEQFQGEVPEPLKEQLQRNVLESLVRSRVISQYAKEQGYRVPNDQVIAYIRGLPAFQIGGEFSSQSYIAKLASQGMTPERFEHEQRLNMEMSQLQRGIVESAFFTPTEYRQFIELEQERRDVGYVIFDPLSLVNEVSPDDEAVAAFFEDNPDSFLTPESVSLEFIEILFDDLASDVEISESAVRDYYDANLDEYLSQEERRASHILIAVDGDTDQAAAETRAAELYQRLQDGEELADLAREYSDDPGSAEAGGDLGWAGSGVYVEPFEEVLFALNEGEVSEPVSTQFGYHIIRLEEVRVGSQQPYEDVRDELLEELRRGSAEDRFYALAEQVDDLALENPGSLAAVAEQTGLKLQTAETITRSGGAPFGFNRLLVEAAFSIPVLEEGENSPVIELGDDRAVVIRVIDHRMPEAKPLAEVREVIVERIRMDAAAELSQSRGNAMLDRLRGDEALPVLAEEFGVELIEAQELTRQSDELPADLLADVFRAPYRGSEQPVAHGLVLGSGGYAVFQVGEVRSGRPEDIPREERDQRKEALARQFGSTSASAMVADLRGKAKVVVAPGLFESENAQEF